MTSFIFCFCLLGLCILPISYLVRGKTGLLVGIIITLLISLTMFADCYFEEKQYNNGICTDCGGNYNFVNAIKNRYGHTIKFYECENCKKIIEK